MGTVAVKTLLKILQVFRNDLVSIWMMTSSPAARLRCSSISRSFLCRCCKGVRSKFKEAIFTKENFCSKVLSLTRRGRWPLAWAPRVWASQSSYFPDINTWLYVKVMQSHSVVIWFAILQTSLSFFHRGENTISPLWFFIDSCYDNIVFSTSSLFAFICDIV